MKTTSTQASVSEDISPASGVGFDPETLLQAVFLFVP